MSTKDRTIVRRLVKMGRIRRRVVIVSLVTILLLLGALPALAQIRNLNVSGYEVFPGVPCLIAGQPAVCGDTFTGWTGGSGFGPNGWVRFPGNGQALWRATLAYQGTPGTLVTIVRGTWSFKFANGSTLHGNVLSGTGVWPPGGGQCGLSPIDGVPVGVVTLNLSVDGGGSATFNGCLDDMPAFTKIPPKAWGTFSLP